MSKLESVEKSHENKPLASIEDARKEVLRVASNRVFDVHVTVDVALSWLDEIESEITELQEYWTQLVHENAKLKRKIAEKSTELLDDGVMNLADEIIPCPWCGNESDLVEMETKCDGMMFYKVSCNDYKCMGANIHMWYKTKLEAIEAWNTRAELEGECIKCAKDIDVDEVYIEKIKPRLIEGTPTEDIRQWSILAHSVMEITGPSTFGADGNTFLWLHENSLAQLLDMCDAIDKRFAELESDMRKFVSVNDNRKKLEEDVQKYVNPSGGKNTIGARWEKQIIEFLDRQVAISDLEYEHAHALERENVELCKQVDELINAVNELQKKQPYCYDPDNPVDTLNTIGCYIDELKRLVCDMWFWSYEGHMDNESQKWQMEHIDGVLDRMKKLGLKW